MSMHSELPALPLELHACQDAREYYNGSCRCAVNTTVISSDHPFDYISNSTRSRADDQGIDRKFDSSTFVEHFGGVSLTSMPRVHRNQRPPFHHHQQPQWKFGNELRSTGDSQDGPIDTGSFECSAMIDSEPSISPASSVSPGSLAQGNSPLGTHHSIPSLEILASHHNHQQHQHQQQQFCGMNTQQVVNNNNSNLHHHHSHLQRGPKRRALDNQPIDGAGAGTGNRKERRRTQSINTAFAELRECIPNVPADTKLSKIKTLRLATSYIAYLSDMVSRDDNMNGDMETTISGMMMEGIGDGGTMPMIRQDFSLTCRSIIKDAIKYETTARNDCEVKRKRNRTGWPEHVWALELQH